MTDYYTAEDKTMPAVCYALYLLGFATAGLTSLVGLVIALSQRAASGPMMHTHYTFMIRTFVIGLVWTLVWCAVFAVAIPFSVILIGIPFLLLAKAMLGVGAIWYGIRCILGLVVLSRGEAYPRPEAMLA